MHLLSGDLLSRYAACLTLVGLAGGVVVEAGARLAAELALLDELGHEVGRLDEVEGNEALLSLGDPALGNELGGVETDEVEELEGTHGVAGTELHGNVNVLGGGVAALNHTDSLEEVGDEETVDDEAGHVLALDGDLAEAHGQLEKGVEDLLRGLGGADDLNELHGGDGWNVSDATYAGSPLCSGDGGAPPRSPSPPKVFTDRASPDRAEVCGLQLPTRMCRGEPPPLPVVDFRV